MWVCCPRKASSTVSIDDSVTFSLASRITKRHRAIITFRSLTSYDGCVLSRQRGSQLETNDDTGEHDNGGTQSRYTYPHDLYSDGSANIRELLEHVARKTDSAGWVIAIIDHDTIDGALPAPPAGI